VRLSMKLHFPSVEIGKPGRDSFLRICLPLHTSAFSPSSELDLEIVVVSFLLEIRFEWK